MEEYDVGTVEELMRDDSPVWVETMWGEGWSLDNFAAHYAQLGWDVTGKGRW